MSRVLVAFASKHGWTAEIAAAIGQSLREHGIDADVVPAAGVIDVKPYDAVVVGSATYIMRWRGEAIDFLHQFEPELSARPVWIFSSGPLETPTVRDRPPRAVRAAASDLNAREVRVFAGRFQKGSPGLAERVMSLANVSGDFRDWNEIARWGATIATQVKALQPVAAA